MLTDQEQRHLPRHGTGERRRTDDAGAYDGANGPCPLTHAQSGLWALERSCPNGPPLTAVTAVRLRGALDVDALRKALADCVERQEALRARFVTLGGRPFQIFVPERPGLPLSTPAPPPGAGADPGPGTGAGTRAGNEDGDGQDAERAVLRRCDALAATRLDPGSGSPFRAELLRLGPLHHVLLLAAHRAVFDGASARVLLAELGAAYGDRRDGRVPQWLPLGASFGELARGQRRTTADGAYTREQVAYWRGALRDAPRLELPGDRPRPATRTFEAGTVTRAVDAATGAGVRALAERLGVPPHTVLTAAFTHLLARISGSPDIVAGLPFAARTAPHAHGVVGRFSAALPLRVHPAGARSFLDLVDRHREPLRELAARQDFPPESVADAVGRPPHAGRGPFSDVSFRYRPDPAAGLLFPGLDAEPLDVPVRATALDLGWVVSDAGEGMRVSARYAAELFDARTVSAFTDAFTAVLARAVADPSALPEPTVRVAAARPDGLPEDGTSWTPGGLAGVVAAQAAVRPEAPAVRYGRRMLTFRGLDTAATRIAGLLTEHGAGPGTAVGLLLTPSAALPVAMLAILRTGAVYVPVDPAVPARRAAETARGAGCGLIVCDAGTEDAAAALGLPLLRLDGRHDGGGAGPVRPVGRVGPASPGYAIFTSGSTGRPRAVLVQHGAALALAASAARAYGLGPRDVALQTASVGVDVSVEEFFASWWAGACVAVPEPGETDLDILVARHRATVLNLPPALWHSWVRGLRESGGRVREPVRLVVVGSDRMDPGAVRTWHDGVGRGVRLLNAYGTTETAVTATCYDTRELPGDSDATGAVPIGRPLAHVSVYVLDARMRPVRGSLPGELWIGGAGVALGYLGDPAATADRFRPDPFSDRPGSRMYRTGDRVRILPSGALDFLGRVDSQVKVRGFRVELEEVERLACEVPGVAGFSADVRPDARGAGCLAGYILAADEPGPGDPADGRTGSAADAGTTVRASGALPGPAVPPAGHLDCAAVRFPSPEGLERAVAGLWTAIRPGGTLVIRNVRDLTTLHAFHAAVLDPGADGETDAVGFAAAVDEAVEAESELCLHPAWFDALASRLPGGAAAATAPALNAGAPPGEPSGHRYDITLTRNTAPPRPAGPPAGTCRAAPPGPSPAPSPSVTPGASPAGVPSGPSPGGPAVLDGGACDLAGLDRLLRSLAGRAGTVTAVRDLRSAAASALAREAASGRHRTLEQARRAAAGARGVTPADARGLAGRHGYAARIRPVPGGRFDLLLSPEPDSPRTVRDPGAADSGTGPPRPPAGTAPGTAPEHPGSPPSGPPPPGTVLANDPASGRLSARLTAAVREHLRAALPPPMVPARLTLVTGFPRTASGKVDRRRLPDPPRLGTCGHGSGTDAPGDELERSLCGIWADALGLPGVGVLDNFFELDGDSVAWTGIIALAGESGIVLDAPDVFDHPTVRELAAHLRSERARDRGRRQDRGRGEDQGPHRPQGVAPGP